MSEIVILRTAIIRGSLMSELYDVIVFRLKDEAVVKVKQARNGMSFSKRTPILSKLAERTININYD